MRKIIAACLGLIVGTGLLSACSVTTAQTSACEESGGIVVTRGFRMNSVEKTESFSFCEVNGRITEFYGLSESDKNVTVPEEFKTKCDDGTIETKVITVEEKHEVKDKDGKKTKTIKTKERRESFICLVDGIVTESFHQVIV